MSISNDNKAQREREQNLVKERKKKKDNQWDLWEHWEYPGNSGIIIDGSMEEKERKKEKDREDKCSSDCYSYRISFSSHF